MRVSSGDALSAHLWKVLAELRARPDDSVERLGMVVGLRSALRAALPDGYWGNAVTNVTPALLPENCAPPPSPTPSRPSAGPSTASPPTGSATKSPSCRPSATPAAPTSS
ncbi:acyltransferase [Streptomyces kaempferi]